VRLNKLPPNSSPLDEDQKLVTASPIRAAKRPKFIDRPVNF
jgi:hypothetical protein